MNTAAATATASTSTTTASDDQDDDEDDDNHINNTERNTRKHYTRRSTACVLQLDIVSLTKRYPQQHIRAQCLLHIMETLRVTPMCNTPRACLAALGV